MRILVLLCIAILCNVNSFHAQAPKPSSSSEIYHSVQKLNFLGTALYIAAHPDDENTRLISYLSNETKARTGYLSLTRGDGGQNLIGQELRELLGVLRTEELLAARSVDGGEQFFTRANDFGYSKHPDETLKVWDKEQVLSDIVWTIRKFRPDVIINRFDHRTPGSTHGHHTSSAILSVEAFDIANDKNAYSQQLSQVTTWQPKRIFFNTSWWFYGSQENFEKADKSKMMELDVGVYYPLAGMSNNEIAATASSQHLCQGFGRPLERGSQPEYIELLKGDMPSSENNLFEGIDTSWSRMTGGEPIGKILYEVESNFNFVDPASHLPSLLKAYTLLEKTESSYWKDIKLEELKNLIVSVSGLFLEATSKDSFTNPGSDLTVRLELLNRSTHKILVSSSGLVGSEPSYMDLSLENNKKKEVEMEIKVSEDTPYSNPYWLNDKWSLGMYKVDEQDLIGNPETTPPLNVYFNLEIEGIPLTIERPVVYKFSKPDKGERYQPLGIIPEATVRFDSKVLLFSDKSPKEVPVRVTAHKDNLKGKVQLSFAEGWEVDKEFQDFEIKKKGEEITLIFKITPPMKDNEAHISPIIHLGNKKLNKELILISYDHIPTQTVLLPSETKVVRLNIEKVGEHIGYIAGAGDEIPESLREIGYSVHMIDPSSIEAGSLDRYDAIVTGIRAYNVNEELKFKQSYLLEYVKNGGNLIIQYNTAGRRDKKFDNLAPYPLSLSRGRVTDETSDVIITAESHPLVNFPNKISEKDFEGWVQERGLYFPDEWDARFTPILSMHDEGESSLEGSLLVAPYGQGNYIYTGLSFFRELPAGVSGAYRLFANMLSLGNEELQNNTDIKGK